MWFFLNCLLYISNLVVKIVYCLALVVYLGGFSGGTEVKKLPAVREPRVYSWVERSSVSLPGEFHGQRSPWGCRELHTTEQLSLFHSNYGGNFWFLIVFFAVFYIDNYLESFPLTLITLNLWCHYVWLKKLIKLVDKYINTDFQRESDMF